MSLAELARRALLGTRAETAPLSAATGQADIDAALHRLVQPESSAATLLRQAALLTLAERAGRVPDCPVLPPVSPCPDDDAPPLPRGAEAILQQVLDGLLPRLAAALVEATATHGYRVPPALLPTLLKWGKQSENRPYVRAVACRKAHWLAAHNPDWRYLVDPDRADNAFETGTPAERREALRQLRTEDPAAALQRLQSGWKQEPPTERAGLIEALAVSLSQADEPFLESVLDDRRKEARLAAAALLAQLPESRLVARMRERLAPCLILTPTALEVVLPAECGTAMERDGIDKKPEIRGIGERAAWLMQMLACVPPSEWCARFGISEARWLELCHKHEFRGALRLGWVSAAANFREFRLAGLWLADMLGHDEWQFDLLNALSPKLRGASELESVTLRALREGRLEPIKTLLPLLPAPWSDEIGAAVMALQSRSYLDLALTHLPPRPEILADLEKVVETIPPTHQAPFKDFLQALNMRIKFIQCLEKS
ncbi:DUF5691 domain-containing protein [Methylomagnum sp.]